MSRIPALLVCVWVIGVGPAQAADRPNVILIMADDMGYECLGCNGSASYETPNLDRLAAGGMRFLHCYSQPLCTPTRIKIMTGRYNFRNYVEFGYLPPAERTFGQVMQAAGYRTLIAGKWQLNGLTYSLDGFESQHRPIDAGFDEYCLWQLTKMKAAGERFADPLIEMNGQPAKARKGGYGPQIFADVVCDFIDRNRDNPFFVYYPMVLVHDPFVPTPDSPEWKKEDRHQRDNRFFADMVAYADKIVGQIDAKLEALGLREDTILIFTADNGTHVSLTSQMRDGTLVAGGKGTTPDAGTRVPLVVSWPGTTPAGVVSEDLIDFTDFFATVADAAGTPQTAEQTDGRSFLPQLRGEPGTPRQYMFCHYDPRWGRLHQYRNRFVRDQTHKLYRDGRLFDISRDVLEQHPLADDDPRSASVRQRLQAVLDSMPLWVDRPLIPRNVSAAASRVTNE